MGQKTDFFQTFLGKKSGSGPKSGNPDLVGDTGRGFKTEIPQAIEEGLTQGQGRDNFIKVDQGPKEGMRIEDQHQDLLIDLLHNERL